MDNLLLLLLATRQGHRALALLTRGWPSRIQWLDHSLRLGRESFRQSWISDYQLTFSLLAARQAGSAELRRIGLEAVLTTKGRVLQETTVALDTLRARLNDSSVKLVEDLETVWRRQRSMDAEKSGSAAARAALREEEDRLSGEIVSRSAEFRPFVQTFSAAAIRKTLGPVALVEMIQFSEVRPADTKNPLGPLHYGAYVARAKGPVEWVDLGLAGSIDTLIRRYRRTIADDSNAAVARDTARELGRLLFDPVRALAPGVTEFYISPDGQARLIPFAALLDRDGQPLLKRYRLHTISTGRDLVLPPPMSARLAPTVAGIRHYGEAQPTGPDFPPLPGADREADEVVKRIPAAQRVPSNRLTRSYLLKTIDAPKILHLATHGFYYGPGPDGDDALTRAGIALFNANAGTEEGILTAKDAAMLHLRGTDLVVLSACETGVGEPSYADGIIGLQRSLVLAGARSQLLTLWPVSDEHTVELMSSFYTNLFEKRMTKGEALRQAQIAMADKGIDPYYWAPFVLYGDSGPMVQ